ncbi:MAG TPA: hypothetical protein VHR18_00630 [Solirubrobacterales bacterium]|jgi:hypothetical protein|nr:hypothetical protein [Solirubrobacterales bacterium]
MRRAFAVAIAVLVLSAALASSAGAGFYRGGGHGIRVSIMVKGDRVLAVTVSAPLYCTRAGREHRRRPHRVFYGAKNPDGSVMTEGPAVFRLDSQHRFELPPSTAPEEPGYYARERFAGQVHHGAVTGRFSYRQVYERSSRVCQTGRYVARRPHVERPRFPALVHFRAVRQ